MQNQKLSKNFLLGMLLLVILAGGIPLILSQTQIQQVLTGRAWSTSQSASAECIASGTVIINVKFTNQESTRSMIVTAVDNQSGKSTSLGTVEPRKSKTGEIDTQKTSLNSSIVTFKLAWADKPNETDTRTADYSKASTCSGPTPTPPQFPNCPDLTPPGDIAHYTNGKHQIAGGDLLVGTDDVYSLPNGNAIQCFCPEEGTNGIQTDWWQTNLTISGWIKEPNGTDWGLLDVPYLAKNSDYTCGNGPTPTPTTPLPSLTPTLTVCPTPGTVKNVQIQCPYCTPSPNPNQ
jgi:hypothetical protein